MIKIVASSGEKEPWRLNVEISALYLYSKRANYVDRVVGEAQIEVVAW